MRLLSKTDKYSLLLKQDKAIALKTHQNDEKRITQFLERIILKGQLISENYESKTSELRSGQTVVFWIKNSDKEELFGMLSKRVHKMLDRDGLS